MAAEYKLIRQKEFSTSFKKPLYLGQLSTEAKAFIR
jgi:hypothetical protein